MAVPFVQVSEEEFRDFGRKHFPGAPQPIVLPSFVTPSANSPPAHNTSPSSAASDIAYNAGFTAGVSFGHAHGRASGYYEGYNAAAAQLGAPTANTPDAAQPDVGHAEADAEDQVYEAHDYEEEEDLGFYPDGVRRTVDDEAVKFYRRSELMQMLKDAKIRVAERKEREAEEQNDVKPKLEAQVVDGLAQAELDKVEPQDVKEVNHDEPNVVKPVGTVVHEPVAPGMVMHEDQADAGADTPSSTTMVGDETCKRPTPLNAKKRLTAVPEAHRGKKRKRPARNPPPDIEGITYRRIARELDQMPNESVELDY
ncbi:uncharacterized protein BKCO1_8000033 [Diplodia corticola]|uniref:Uncharacterized protein n=1 Tax=Diplodia corticola TaxID=236234 RepID=A0A1J9RAM2_9PEZI|nr:uncharacterized protein BKCO1_8000033 [Diplodia corticola]OJD29467.1 hypothetical protein BKCO1_8000033 [Diplodia corticola]